jgi:REP element-mobilizing transposase RayT
MITRRVTQRRFYLKPSRQKKVARAFRYCVARAATLTGVKVHVVVVMGNHYHLIVSDPHGLIPYFAEILNKNLARCLNALYGRWENFWAGAAAPSYVRLDSPAEVIAECVYALTNPVEAGLVSSRRLWPGELLEQPGNYRAPKPDWFFRKEDEGGKLPDTAYLELTAAPAAPTAAASVRIIKEAADAEQDRLRKDRLAQGKSFMGADAIMRQSIHDSPNSPASRRTLSPTLAGKDKWRRIELLRITADFRRDHRSAMEQWMAGNRDVVFPAGTYKMRVIHKARIAEA